MGRKRFNYRNHFQFNGAVTSLSVIPTLQHPTLPVQYNLHCTVQYTLQCTEHGFKANLNNDVNTES